MSYEWMRLSVRFLGDGLDLDAVSTLLQVEPALKSVKGTHMQNNAKYARYTTHLWVWELDKFEKGLEEILSKRKEIAQILKTTDVKGELRIGVGGKGNCSFELSAPILKEIGGLGLSLFVDAYN